MKCTVKEIRIIGLSNLAVKSWSWKHILDSPTIKTFLLAI